jgi:uncharacterized protein YndB with AHSA1/START domain
MPVNKIINNPAATPTEQELVITRLFDAPRDLVFKVWTESEHLEKWQNAPQEMTVTVEKSDIRTGGSFRICMHAPDGTKHWLQGGYREVIAPEKLVFTHTWLNAEGKPGPETLVMITLTERGNQTELTLRQTGFKSIEAREGHRGGWISTFDRLAKYLKAAADAEPSEATPVILERTYGAPADLVWKAITEIDQMKQWYMPVLDSFKAEVGFETKFSVRHEGKEFPHVWKVTEVVPGKKIAYSWKFPGHPGESLATFELFPEGENTRLKLTHSGLETHDGRNNPDLARKNFQWGWNELGDELEKFLARDEAFIITRVFDAPRELVWQVWTDPEHLKNWWRPKGLSMISCTLDLRPGGMFHYGMKTQDGHEMWGKFVYRHIDPPKKLVLVVSFSDAQRGTTRHPMSATWPLEVLNTMTLVEENGKTNMTLHGMPINATAEERKTFKEGHSSMQQGFKGTLDQLAEYLTQAQKVSRKA